MEEPEDWLPQALLLIAIIFGAAVLGMLGCASTRIVVPPPPIDLGIHSCTSTQPHPLPGSCGQRSTERFYCTVCLNDELCVSPKSTYCVARDLGCDDPVCK